MESYAFKNVDFTYPEGDKKALRNISFTVQQGEFVILCGPSGCGKSTLLRHLKSCLTPHGLFAGEIRYQGKLLSEMSQREQAREIGYVLQSPENQVVTDKVWHELAFGLESLGYDTPTIRRRVAEIAAFFGKARTAMFPGSESHRRTSRGVSNRTLSAATAWICRNPKGRKGSRTRPAEP